MIKRVFLLVFLLWFYAFANAQITPVAATDTTVVTDSLKVSMVNDSKKIMKDLFISNEKGGYSVDLNPRVASFVESYIQKHRKNLENMKGWGRPYFDMMSNVLTAHGLPAEMKYLAVIESNLKTYAVSWAGAVGPWQFMPATARRMGLKVNYKIDERTDYYKSTHAAARYLTELFVEYGDWLLVIAAYNGGSGNVNYAIRKSKSKNFWDLQYYLPEESRNHVKKFIATHYIFEGNGGITTVTKDEARDIAFSSATGKKNLSDEEMNSSKTQLISGKYNSLVITKNIMMDLNTFIRYNPDFDKQMSVNGKYELRLPADKMDVFFAKKNQILDESIKLLLAPAGAETKLK